MKSAKLLQAKTMERPEDVITLLREHGRSISKSAARQILTFLKHTKSVIESYDKQDTPDAVTPLP